MWSIIDKTCAELGYEQQRGCLIRNSHCLPFRVPEFVPVFFVGSLMVIFVLCFVVNVACVSGFSILDCHFGSLKRWSKTLFNSNIDLICTFFVTFFSATIDVWSQASYRYPISWEAFLNPSDSYFLFADCWFLYTFNIHLYMHIFRRIFLGNYWWQESDIWSQASYRYPISW